MKKKITLLLLLLICFGNYVQSQTDNEVAESQLKEALRFFKLCRTNTNVYLDRLNFDTDSNNDSPVSTAASGIGLIALAIEAELGENNPTDGYTTSATLQSQVIETLKAYTGESSYNAAKAPNGFF